MQTETFDDAKNHTNYKLETLSDVQNHSNRKRKRKPKRVNFKDLSFYRKAEFYELLNWLALHPTYADIIMSIVAKEHRMAQRIIEYTQTGFAKKYKLRLDNGRFDVRERFKFGPRKDPNCRGEWFPIPFKEEVYRTTTRQLHDLIFVVASGITPESLRIKKFPLGPLYNYIEQNYEVIKNDLNFNRDLIPNKKDISNIPRPHCQAPRPAAFWNKKPRLLG